MRTKSPPAAASGLPQNGEARPYGAAGPGPGQEGHQGQQDEYVSVYNPGYVLKQEVRLPASRSGRGSRVTAARQTGTWPSCRSSLEAAEHGGARPPLGRTGGCPASRPSASPVLGLWGPTAPGLAPPTPISSHTSVSGLSASPSYASASTISLGFRSPLGPHSLQGPIALCLSPPFVGVAFLYFSSPFSSGLLSSAFRGLGVPLCSRRLPDLAASSLCCCFAVSGSPRPLCPPQTLSLPPASQAAGGSLPVLLVFRFLHCLPPCLQTPLLTAHPFAVRKRAGCRQFGREGWSQLQKVPFLASAIGQALEADLASSSSKAVASIW